MVKKWAAPGIALLVGVGFTVMGWTNPVVGGLLIGIGLLWTALLLPPVAHRMPHVSLERSSRADGVALRVRPPEARGKKRLRQETERLVSDMHEYLRSQPDPMVESLRDHDERVRAMEGASTEEERRRLWQEFNQRMVEKSGRERQELAALFGGRLRYVLHEYQQRSMISESEASRLQFEAQSTGWLHDAASTLESLAKRL